MKSTSKILVASLALTGSVFAADLAQAIIELNGTGSSAGRQYAGLTPTATTLCDAGVIPTYYHSLEAPPNRTEWHCKRSGADVIYRYSASGSADGYTKLPNGATQTASYLTISGLTGFSACQTAVSTTIGGRTVNESTCGTLDSDPATVGNQTVVNPNTARVVDFGASDVQNVSFNATAFGATIAPPAKGHLVVTPIVAVPFSIVVGGNVRNADGTIPTNISTERLKEILTGRFLDNGSNWETFNFTTSAGSKDIVVCQRTVISGTLAALNRTILNHPPDTGINPTADAQNVANPSSSNVKACVENNLNSIGYIDSDTVPNLLNGARQIAVDGWYPSNDAYATGLVPADAGFNIARTKDVRCGNYKYWVDWVLIKRIASLEAAPFSRDAGTNAALDAYIAAAKANNPLPNFWGAANDMFIEKLSDGGNHNFSKNPNGAGKLVTDLVKDGGCK